jgi:hypothetical protein
MAYLACVAGHTINGVAAIHSEIIKDTIFKARHAIWSCCFGGGLGKLGFFGEGAGSTRGFPGVKRGPATGGQSRHAAHVHSSRARSYSHMLLPCLSLFKRLH